MEAELIDIALGPVSLTAPGPATRLVRADHGYLWQWIGDGEEYFSLSVAVRGTRLGTIDGVRDHLDWEVRQVEKSLTRPQSRAPSTRPVLVMVDGAASSAAADVDGEIAGRAVHNRVVVTTDGEHMHVVRALVPDHAAGRELSETMTSTLEVLSWAMPDAEDRDR